MAAASRKHDPVTFVLGAGASRGVSYARTRDMLSPLDRDFFDLLQRLEPQDKDEPAVAWVVGQMTTLPLEHRRSLEKAFYTLHLRSYLRRKLAGADRSGEEAVVSQFARAVVALLRKAHGTQTCENHKLLFKSLNPADAVVSFNYDLVVERALRACAEGRKIPFSPAMYCLKRDDQPPKGLPKILKLHGSVNWDLHENELKVRTGAWDDFEDAPGYRGYSGDGTKFPILLPFWDKQVTREPWLTPWQRAHEQLRETKHIIVWGFSLPTTDVKVRELFAISVPQDGAQRRLCVIDPSQAARDRWRELLPNAQYWEYDNIKAFKSAPPAWWWNS